MTKVEQVNEILARAGLRTVEDAGDGGFLGTPSDCATSGPSRHFPASVTVAPHVPGEWHDGSTPACRAVADRATLALAEAGLSPHSRAGWRTVVCVAACGGRRGSATSSS